MAGQAGLPGDSSRARLRGALTLPLRLCTLKAMLGDMSRSRDSCSESFFFSLSMALLPLFALCGERLHGQISVPGASATCSHLARHYCPRRSVRRRREPHLAVQHGTGSRSVAAGHRVKLTGSVMWEHVKATQ